jgi:hypothetical protein
MKKSNSKNKISEKPIKLSKDQKIQEIVKETND